MPILFPHAVLHRPIAGLAIRKYSISTLSGLGLSARGDAINDSGQVVGVTDSWHVPFVAVQGRARLLPLPVGVRLAEAVGIDGLGGIVLEASGFLDRYRAYLWRDGAFLPIALSEPSPTLAKSSDNSGEVTGGSVVAPGILHAFLWKAGAASDLGASMPQVQSMGWGVRGRTVVGEFGPNIDLVGAGGHAAAWVVAENGQQFNDLGEHCGFANSRAVAVNAGSEIVGIASNEAISGKYASGVHALLWQGIVAKDLGILPPADAYARHIRIAEATAISDSGVIVGDALVKRGLTHAFVWKQGVMQDLNGLILASRGIVLTQAVSINSSGQILCNGTWSSGKNDGEPAQSAVFVLTPFQR